MSRVLAAIDNSAAARPVLRAACVFAALLGAVPEAIHVRTHTTRTAVAEAAAAGVPLRLVDGDAVEVLTAALAADDVVLGVFGARGQPSGARPAGHTTMAAATRASKPVLVVPPEARVGAAGQRVRIVVPLDGTADTDRGAQHARRLFDTRGIDITVLHVFADDAVPRFWDQPYHEHEAWGREFVARHWPAARPAVRLSQGAPGEAVLAAAEAEACDAIALVWGQRFAGEHAQSVRQVVTRAPIPILLLPVPGARAWRAGREPDARRPR